MIKIDRLTVKYHNKVVGTLSLTPDNKLCAFEYDTTWLVDGFSISPLELPLKSGLFIDILGYVGISELYADGFVAIVVFYLCNHSSCIAISESAFFFTDSMPFRQPEIAL